MAAKTGSTADSDAVAVVVDNGSTICKVGFAENDAPAVCIPTMVGYIRERPLPGTSSKDPVYVGDEADSRRSFLDLKYPIEHGLITNWDDMNKVWDFAFNRGLGERITLQDHPVMLTEPPGNPKANREKICEIMFETYGTPALYIGNQAVLSLYASGSVTGVVFESGGGASHFVPVYDGYAIPHATLNSEISGRDLTSYLMKLLNEEGKGSYGTQHELSVSHIKEQLCYVALDFKQELQTRAKNLKTYKLPGGDVVTIGSACFRCPETLFQPSFIRKESLGIHEICNLSISKCDGTIQKELYKNIVLSGGNTMFSGIVDRMQKEMVTIAPVNLKHHSRSVNVTALPERRHGAWLGGSILASLSTFQSNWFTKQEYDEFGPYLVHQKCLM